MWEPNEQLLLRAAVRYKKHDGTLFVTPRRVAWQQQGSSQLTPSIYYKDIKGKSKINLILPLQYRNKGTYLYLVIALAQTPESSPKVLLKISVNPPISKDYTFQFTSAKSIQERESIKAQIAELLARVRGLTASQVGTPVPITPSSTVASPSPSTPQSVNTTSSPAASLQQQAAVNITRQSTPSNAPSPGPNSPKSWRQEEFNDRKQLLTSSRELQTLHRELVVIGKSVDEEEFWSSPYVKRIRQVTPSSAF
jgi:transcription initiation factor TFIIH subunit 1